MRSQRGDNLPILLYAVIVRGQLQQATSTIQLITCALLVASSESKLVKKVINGRGRHHNIMADSRRNVVEFRWSNAFRAAKEEIWWGDFSLSH